jgi:hypothetical protein
LEHECRKSSVSSELLPFKNSPSNLNAKPENVTRESEISRQEKDVRLRLQPIWQVVELILFWEEILFFKVKLKIEGFS